MSTLLKKTSFCTLAVLLVMFVFVCTGSASAISDDVKTAVDRVLSVMQDPAYAGPDKKAERERLIHAAVADKFSWEEMSKRALGAHWRDLTPAQQKEFVGIFKDFLERTYISKVDLFLKEEKTFSAKNIVYAKETIDGQYALVDSKVTLHEEEIPLSYKLLNKNGVWVVYDMSIEGVGIVANYRTQFNELLANGSYDKMIEKLKSKQGEDIVEKKAAATDTKKQ